MSSDLKLHKHTHTHTQNKYKKLGAADLTIRHLADKILYRALLVNVYQCAKF